MTVRSLPEEVHQGAIDFLGVGPQQAVWSTFHYHVVASLKALVQRISRRGDRKDPIGVAVEDKRGHVDLWQVGAEVGQLRRDAFGKRYCRGAGGEVPARPHDLVANQLSPQDVSVVEVS